MKPLLVSGVYWRMKFVKDAGDILGPARSPEGRSLRDQGLPSPTWEISDRVRALGLDGMLYSSRSDPGKTHLTLFRWNEPNAAHIALAGDPLPFRLS